MEEKKKVPAVRFKGFTGDWERRKLGEVFKEYSEKNHPELPPLTIVQGRGTVLREDSERALQYDKSSLPSYKLVNKDDFIVHLRSFEGGLEKATTQGIISPAYHTFHGEGTDSRFYYAYFRSQKFVNHDLFPYVYGIRDGRSIDIDGMKKIRLPFPSYAEQKKIGDFIDTIDGYSTLHQQKLDQLKKLKAYFLQNLFPAKGEKVPKIRFKGFTDDWEQRKLSTVFEKFDDGDWIESKDQSTSGIRLIQTGNIGVSKFIDKPNNKKWISADTFARLHCEEIFPGDILISRLPEPAGRACIMPNIGTRMITAVDCTIARASKENSADFIVQYLSTPNYFKWVNTCLAGGTRQRISRSTLSNFEIMLPPTLTEQIKIGRFLSSLDTLITLHQRKLEALQTLKKFLLQNLFV